MLWIPVERNFHTEIILISQVVTIFIISTKWKIIVWMELLMKFNFELEKDALIR